MKTYAEALYRIKRGFLIIGLTGYTGSGCTTACGILRKQSKPKLPKITALNNKPEERLYGKLERVTNSLPWEKFINIEVSRVIFMLAIHRALRYNFKTGQLAKLRELVLPYKGDLEGVSYLTKSNINVKKADVAKKLVDAYQAAKRLYGRFKTKCGYDLAGFIEVMQDFGDDIRKFGYVQPIKGREPKPKSISVLPEALRRLIGAYRVVDRGLNFVIDAFRNPYEVEYFKRRYSEFYLVAIQRSARERRQTLQGLNSEAIERLENREKGRKIKDRRKDNIHEWVTSQNLDECFQKADYFIENVYDTSRTWPQLRYDLIKLLCLVRNPGCILPNQDERNMQIAMSARYNSGCLSRRVGAVVVNSQGHVLGVGWNDPPCGQVPCTLRTGKELIDTLDKIAFSEYERSSEFVEHIRARCYTDLPYCFKDEYGVLTGKEKVEFTRALHAEENALLQAIRHGSGALTGVILYTTDSPCTLCAKKAYQLGVGRIIYIEEYPGIDMQQTLMTGEKKIKLEQFKGTTGSGYDRLFSSLMSEKDMLNLYT